MRRAFPKIYTVRRSILNPQETYLLVTGLDTDGHTIKEDYFSTVRCGEVRSGGVLCSAITSPWYGLCTTGYSAHGLHRLKLSGMRCFSECVHHPPQQ